MARNNHRLRSILPAAAALAAWVGPAMAPPAYAGPPQAGRALYSVQVYTQRGATTGCGLSFIAGWTNDRGQSFAAAGVARFTAGGDGIDSTLKVRANMNNSRRTLSFAWMGVDGAGDTKAFKPPDPDQTGPFFSYLGMPDPQGPARLRAAARRGFLLDLSIIGLPRDETVRLPPAPENVATRLGKCSNAAARR